MRKTKKLCAFTLAEVLITLAIIGVVASLTIASVVSEYRKQTYYTQFMKTYNTLSNALNLAIMANGNPDSWGFVETDTSTGSGYDTNHQILLNNLAPYLKTSKICPPLSYCDIPSNTKTYLLNGNEFGTYGGFDSLYYRSKFILQDGALITMSQVSSLISFDVNGPNKGPNTYGQDLFSALSIKKMDNKFQLTATGLVTYDSYKETNVPSTPEWIEERIAKCNDKTTSYYDLWYCTARLLYKHKMDY